MRFRQSDKHVIDVIFPLAILFVFAASALLVLLLSAHTYADQTTQTESNYEASTPLSYITEKVRQNDENGNISIEELDGISCLALHGTSEDMTYTTYLYAYDGWLKELQVRDDTTASLDAGKDVIEVQDFQVEDFISTDAGASETNADDENSEHINQHTYKITVTDASGITSSRILTERSSR